MRSKLRKALVTIAKLNKMPQRDGMPFGETAKDLTEDEAARIGRRLERAAANPRDITQPNRKDEAGRGIPRVAAEAIERNAPCPCGSGKKHKKCCGFVQPSGPRIEAMALDQFRPGVRCTGSMPPPPTKPEVEIDTDLASADPQPRPVVEIPSVLHVGDCPMTNEAPADRTGCVCEHHDGEGRTYIEGAGGAEVGPIQEC